MDLPQMVECSYPGGVGVPAVFWVHRRISRPALANGEVAMTKKGKRTALLQRNEEIAELRRENEPAHSLPKLFN